MARSSTTYPTKWKHGRTTVIRIPAVMAAQLLDIARHLDAAPGFQMEEDSKGLLLRFSQSRRAVAQYTADSPINVASVPQLSPFRYPGGKTWLVPYIRDWLRSKKKPPSRLIEPFAGGAIVSLTAAFERLAKHVVFGEVEDGVAAVWRVVLNGQAEWLAREILRFEVNIENVKSILGSEPKDLREKAFQTILRNRMQRGGIMALGAGLLKEGENKRGLMSRWYPETLARRIREINRLKDRLTFVEGDGFALIKEHQADRESVFYIDPPYTLSARRLYSKWEVDHAQLFSTMKSCKGDFLMSYDNTVEITDLAKKHGFETRPIAMKNTHHAKMTELLIGKDLSWVSRRLRSSAVPAPTSGTLRFGQ